MARVEISSMPWGTLWDRHGEGQNGVTATLKNLDGTNATTWSAITGGTSSTASLTADASGNLPRFVEGGQYTLDVPALSITGRRVEAVSGSVESGSELAINVAKAPYSLTPGATAPEVTIQLALDAANANAVAGSGPTEVYVPPGTYTGMDLHLIPGQGSGLVYACLWMYSGVTLRLSDGAVLKVKDNLAMPTGGTRAHVIANYGGWRSPTSGGYRTRKAKIIGGVIDCNGANHHATSQAPTYFTAGEVITEAVALLFAVDSTVRDVTVKNVYGTSSGPPGETWHFATWYARDCAFENCRAYTDDGSSSATGFSDGNSFGTRYANCVSHGMTTGMGFTVYQCAATSYTGCHVWTIGGPYGFNAEISNDVTYTACTSGGQTPLYTLTGNPEHPDWTGGQTRVGANIAGWAIQGCTRVVVDPSCQSFYNGFQAVKVVGNSSVTPRKANDHVTFQAMIGYNNAGGTETGGRSNIFVERLADGGSSIDQTAVYVDCVVKTDAGYGRYVWADQPSVQYDGLANNSVGLRYVLRNRFNYAVRWFRQNDSGTVASTPSLAISSSGQVETAGRVRRTTAQAGASYTAVATDDVVLCTGTGSTAQTITLPTAASGSFDSDGATVLGNGRTFTVKDQAGAAATNNITVATTSAQTIDGAASYVIKANYGSVTFISDGTNWSILQVVGAPSYVPLTQGAKVWTAQAAGSFVLSEAGAATSGGGLSAQGVFYLSPTETPTLRLTGEVLVNDTAPTSTFTFRLRPAGTITGGVGVLASTPGTAVTNASAAVAAPAANSLTEAHSSDFPCPAAGFYVVEVQITTNMVANSAALNRFKLEARRS